MLAFSALLIRAAGVLVVVNEIHHRIQCQSVRRSDRVPVILHQQIPSLVSLVA